MTDTPPPLTDTPPEPTDELFEHAINVVLSHEGGYSHSAHDHGGVTKFGISKRSYPNIDIANLTIDEAKAIYKRDFWDTQIYKGIKDVDLATKIFDLSVNMGSAESHLLVQRALKVTGQDIPEDGVFGENTLVAINQANPIMLLAAVKSEAAGYYRMLAAAKPLDAKFLNGWLKRAYA